MTSGWTKTDLALKIKIMKKFENDQTLTSLSREFDLCISTVDRKLRTYEGVKDNVRVPAAL